MDRTRLHIALSLLLALASGLPLRAMESQHDESPVSDSICGTADTISARGGIVQRVLNYFKTANEVKPGKGLDFSIIGGPYYTSEIGVGIGLVASGLYGTGVNDSLIPPSNLGIFGKVSTKGFAEIGVQGTHISPENTYRLTYSTEFFADPSDFWGIGYEMDNNDANKSSMKRIGMKVNGAMLFHLGHNLYFGPMLVIDYIHGFEVENRELLDGMRSTLWSYGAGVTLSYDSRDVLTNPHKGFYAALSQCFRPKFIGNRYGFSTTKAQFDWYRSLWNGAILACDVRGEFNFGNPPWNLMAQTGGTHFMRGYYEGRYRDKHMMAIQVELRQHVWRRSGIVVWAAAASVFDRLSNVTISRVLPNLGIGYRWEFKKDVNVRLDVGFGKSGQNGVMFGINEAF